MNKRKETILLKVISEAQFWLYFIAKIFQYYSFIPLAFHTFNLHSSHLHKQLLSRWLSLRLMTALENAKFEVTLDGCFLDLAFHIYRYFLVQIWSKIFLGLILKPFITSNLSTYFDRSLLIKLLRIIVEVGHGVVWLTQQKIKNLLYLCNKRKL